MQRTSLNFLSMSVIVFLHFFHDCLVLQHALSWYVVFMPKCCFLCMQSVFYFILFFLWALYAARLAANCFSNSALTRKFQRKCMNPLKLKKFWMRFVDWVDFWLHGTHCCRWLPFTKMLALKNLQVFVFLVFLGQCWAFGSLPGMYDVWGARWTSRLPNSCVHISLLLGFISL